MKQLLLFILCPVFMFAQTQIGSDIDGEAEGDLSGTSISLSSDGLTIAIGAYVNDGNGDASGHVRVYTNENGVWAQIGNDIDGEAAGDVSGINVSLSSNGTIVAIGAPSNDENGNSSGHVRVYANENGTWMQIGNDIDGDVPSQTFGKRVSLSSDGSIVAIGSVSFFGDNSVRIYKNVNGIWTLIGNPIIGINDTDFGGSISLSSNGSIAAVGASYENGVNGNSSGRVRVYINDNSTWTQIGNDIDGDVVNEQSGKSVSLSSDGSIVAVGSVSFFGNNSVRIYKNENGIWTQIGNPIIGVNNSDFGYSISLSSNGSIVAIGAYSANGVNGDFSGNVKIYKNENDTWNQIGNDIDGESSFDNSGCSVSLSSDGTIVAIGANGNDDNGSNSGHVRVYDLSTLLSTKRFELDYFKIYPNPTKNQFTIQLDDSAELDNVNIYNNLGQLVLTTKEITIDSSKLTSGLYIVEIETNKGKGTKKLIIE